MSVLKLSDLGRRSFRNKDGFDISLRSGCAHNDEHYELRRHIIANGATVYKFECQICGRRGNAIPKNDPIRASLTDDLPYTDPGLQDRYWRQVDQERAMQQRLEADERRRDYDEYLASPEWRAKADLVLARDWYQCQAKLDGCTTTAEHVHHLTYDHLFNEPLFELVAVCRSCHHQLHGQAVMMMGVAV